MQNSYPGHFLRLHLRYFDLIQLSDLTTFQLFPFLWKINPLEVILVALLEALQYSEHFLSHLIN